MESYALCTQTNKYVNKNLTNNLMLLAMRTMQCCGDLQIRGLPGCCVRHFTGFFACWFKISDRIRIKQSPNLSWQVIHETIECVSSLLGKYKICWDHEGCLCGHYAETAQPWWGQTVWKLVNSVLNCSTAQLFYTEFNIAVTACEGEQLTLMLWGQFNTVETAQLRERLLLSWTQCSTLRWQHVRENSSPLCCEDNSTLLKLNNLERGCSSVEHSVQHCGDSIGGQLTLMLWGQFNTVEIETAQL